MDSVKKMLLLGDEDSIISMASIAPKRSVYVGDAFRDVFLNRPLTNQKG